MEKKQYFTLTNDFVFKIALENNKEALFKLCTVFIEDLKKEEYNEKEVKIQKTDYNHLEYKSSIMDVRFDVTDKFLFDLEMQKTNPTYILEDRMLKYHAELIIKSYPKDDSYKHLTCYSLWFLNFLYYDDGKPIHTLRWDSAKNRAGSITVVEIEKLKNYNDNIWYKLFTEKDYSKIRGKDRIMDDLVKEVDYINENDSLSYLASSRHRFIVEQNALKDGYETQLREGLEKGLAEGREKAIAEGRAQGLSEGRAQGLSEGRAQGIAEGRKEEAILIALNLKKRGMTIDEIVEITNLTKEEIEVL